MREYEGLDLSSIDDFRENSIAGPRQVDRDSFWEGVLLRDLIERAGPAGTANTVVFRAADGYSTSLPLDYLLDYETLLACSMNGVEFPPERGFPFQLVAEDKWGHKRI